MTTTPVLKVRMYPSLAEAEQGSEGGILTIIRALYRVMPAHGVEFVDDYNEADVIATHSGYYVGIREKPVVALTHGLYFTGMMDSENWEYEANAQVIEAVREAAVVVSPSQWVADLFRRDMHRDPVVIPHGIFLSDWQTPVEKRPFALWNKNRITDVCDPTWVGVLAEAFPDYEFVSTYHPQARAAKITKEYPNVHALNQTIPNPEMIKLVAASSIYLATTKETFGVGILEALAAGSPVLAFDEGSARDLVIHKVTGYLAKDQEDLVAGFAWLVENADSIRDVCRNFVNGYDWQSIGAIYASVFQWAIDKFRWLKRGEVAVVLPTFNRGDTLARALDSVLLQTYKPKRIIVVDNNSTDNTQEIALSYADKGVEYTNAERQGVAHARNHGIAMLEQPYVCTLDPDDEIRPEFLELTVGALVADPTLGVAYTGIFAIQPSGERYVTEWPPQYNFDQFLKVRNQVTGCCVFRTDMWRSIGGYRQRYAPKGAGAEDADFFLRAGARGWRARKVSDEGLFVYHMGIGITSKPGYYEVDWRYWHPWTKDDRHPVGSLARPTYYSHPVIWYDDPYVSVVIPTTRNHLQYLWDALDSLEGQTVRKWECIVVLDFELHPLEPELELLRDAYPFVRWVGGEGKGAGAARNRGAKETTAPRLLFLDADDFLRPDAMGKMLTALEENDAVAFSDYVGHATIDVEEANVLKRGGRLIAHDDKTNYAHIRFPAEDYDCVRTLHQPAEKVEDRYLWCLVTSLIRKEWHDQIGGFDEDMTAWEDWLYWLRMAWDGICFVRIPETLVEYRLHTGERREGARQITNELLHLMRVKKAGIEKMPCGSCGKKRAQVEQYQSSALPMGLQGVMMNEQNSEGFLMVRLNDGNYGAHRFVGPETRTDYGYRVQDDEFLIAPADYAAKADVLVLVEEAPKKSKKEAVPVADAPTVKEEASSPGEGERVESETVGAPAADTDNDLIPLAAIDGISASALKSLDKAGYKTLADAVEAGRDTLLALDHVGEKTVDLILSMA